ncbi:peptide chain release factor N(5)-glutamine methyltransferase [Algicola sagamiensis]|uniref:peptide chain release factor N(5)-glutamine methyltransferase n=1 Tax=Algicola sagamiensis TaxID=163869 RepID=UPI00037010CE|nr:peptide chain release factor N(5)-glutamine methyltransferase [Algicola sagamiensis]
MQTIQSILDQATQAMKGISETAKLDGQCLMCHVLNCSKTYLFTWPDKVLSEEQKKQFEQLLSRRVEGEPIAYILKEREFWSLSLETAPSTLIPRPDTERLVELALESGLQNQGKLVDLGTGTGAIALAFASERPDWQVYGCDLSKDAVELAKRNQKKTGFENARFFESSWFSKFEENGLQDIDILVSNPPYIDPQDPHLDEGDVRFEPKSALIADNHGLADIQIITHSAPEFLKAGGWLLIEHGFEQGKAVRDCFEDAGFIQVKTYQDYGENDRVTLGQKQG